MAVSVIIPTYNGANKLPIILKSLEKQTYRDFETVVVVDGSTDNTLDVLREYEFRFPEFRIIAQENRGRAAVRNAGAMAAKNELFIFFDDDLLLDATCLEEHVKHHQVQPGSILTGGLKNPEDFNDSEFSAFKEYLGKRWSKGLLATEDKPLTEDSIFVMAANLSLTKAVFFQLKGFDENLNDAEDYDFGVRAFREGISLYFKSSPSAIHYENPTVQQYIKRLNQYKEAKKQLVKLKPELYLHDNVIDVVPPKGLKRTFFNFFRNNWWLDSIENKTWVWLPASAKFKLYDYIITANSIF